MAFPATHLSVIQRIASDDAELRAAGAERMARVYWEPICTYITLTHRIERDVAEDSHRDSSRRFSAATCSRSTILARPLSHVRAHLCGRVRRE